MGLPLAALLQEEKLTDDQVFPGLAGVRLHNKSRGREGEGEGGWKGGVRTMINKSAGVHTKLLHNNHSPAHPTQPTRSAFLFFGGGGIFCRTASIARIHSPFFCFFSIFSGM